MTAVRSLYAGASWPAKFWLTVFLLAAALALVGALWVLHDVVAYLTGPDPNPRDCYSATC